MLPKSLSSFNRACCCITTILISASFFRSALADTSPKLIPSGKIIARSGDIITGYHISNPDGPCIAIQNVEHVTIVGNRIGPCGSDPKYSLGIYINQSSDIQILNNSFSDVSSALYAVNSNSGKVLFEGNYATRIRGPKPRGQLVQLNQFSGPNIVIRCNVSDQAIGGYTNSDGGGGPEDHVNIYKSSGTGSSPIQILDNKIRGGGSKSGGGILAVDDGNGGNVIINGNILVEPGQYGLGIPSGSNVQLTNNQIYATQQPWTNVGVYVWNQYKNTACTNNTVSGNRIFYVNKNGNNNPYWNSGNCGPVNSPQSNQLNDSSLTNAIWNTVLPACKTSWRTW
jgi:Right handed beta helix region